MSTRSHRRSHHDGRGLADSRLASAASSEAISLKPFRCVLSAVFNSFEIARHVWRFPPFQALRDARALPSALRGPVDRSQGRHCLIAAACRSRRSAGQPFAICLQ